MSEVGRLLRGALVPIDPPGRMGERLERRLTELTDAAVDELAGGDPSALRDPRRWARVVVAGVIGAGARRGPLPRGGAPEQKKRGGPRPPAPGQGGGRGESARARPR